MAGLGGGRAWCRKGSAGRFRPGVCLSHCHVEQKRRADFLEEWRKYRNTVVRPGDVTMHETARGMRRGVYAGAAADRPTRSRDALGQEDRGC